MGPSQLARITSHLATVVHPATIHITANDVNPPQIDAPPLAITAAAGIPLDDLLGDIIDIDQATPVSATAATAPQIALGVSPQPRRDPHQKPNPRQTSATSDEAATAMRR